MEVSIPVLQVVGYKKSGKTTLIKKIIEEATSRGLRVAALKHHGHGGPPEAAEGTDSVVHQRAGAVMSGVAGEGVLQLSIVVEDWPIDKIMAFYALVSFDFLVIEGYKKERFPKIVLVRKEEDLHLIEDLTEIVAIISPEHVKIKRGNYEIFTNQEECLSWIMDYMISSLKK
ncbi:molybdopterin-guanine dinucleotide biosynthesis protein B [Peribacillus tepidiphilus]|uniref:molybdopterin-guanine dinucleotide biosynthesis protein B n=1 Tax=Peribacillus tepidiphilus TaxID=2652445 RepID=UPI0035B5255C